MSNMLLGDICERLPEDQLKDIILNILKESREKFHIEFMKTNGDVRKMISQFGVKPKDENGNVRESKVKRKSDPSTIGVYESRMASNGKFVTGQYRSFKRDRIISISMRGVKFEFDEVDSE